MPRELYSVSKLATELGMDRRTIVKRLEGLKPARDGARGAKLFYLSDVIPRVVDAAVEDAIKNRRVAGGSVDGKELAEEMADAKLRLAVAQADQAEIELRKTKGDLIESERVQGLWENLVTAFRAKLLSLPSRASVQTAGLDPKAVERHIDAMVREALEELAAGDEEQDEDEAADGN